MLLSIEWSRSRNPLGDIEWMCSHLLFTPMTSCGGGACLRQRHLESAHSFSGGWVSEGVGCRSSYIARTVMSEMQFQDYTSISTLWLWPGKSSCECSLWVRQCSNNRVAVPDQLLNIECLWETELLSMLWRTECMIYVNAWFVCVCVCVCIYSCSLSPARPSHYGRVVWGSGWPD